jgi:nucleoside-diphosphate-sugar epimerase
VKVLVAGASGVIGRPLVRQLLGAGHEVTGTTRSDARAEQIRATGATAVICDALDAPALAAAVAEARPEVVVHELTALPQRLDPRKRGVYEATNRIRREGTANLVAAAQAAGARRLVAQSVAFIYERGGGWVKGEDEPTQQPGAGKFGETVGAVLDLEQQVLEAEGLEGLVLRYGFFYGPRSSYARDGYQAELVGRRRFPIVGAGTGTFSFIHVDDAAGATVAAVEHGAPGIYNVSDDEPAPLREWLPVYAQALGAKPPRHLPAWVGRLAIGEVGLSMMTRIRGASNAKAKRELGWTPRYGTWREGFRTGLGDLPLPDESRR